MKRPVSAAPTSAPVGPATPWMQAHRCRQALEREARAAARDALVARYNAESVDVAVRRPIGTALVRADGPPRGGRALGEGRLVLRGERPPAVIA